MRAAVNRPAKTRGTRLSRAAAFAAGEAIFVLACAAAMLQPWHYDLRVPFYYGSDALWFTTVVKGLMLNGWPFDIPQLSAPFVLNAAAFPATTTVDWALMKLLAMFAGSAAAVLNTFWLLSLVLTAWSASAALVLLGVTPWLAFTGGVLYALLPGAFIRNVIHINLVYYAVPLLCLLAVHVARGSYDPRRDRRIRRIGYAAAVVQGLNYIYFTFFAVLLLAVAALIAELRGHRPGGWRVPLVASAILIFTAGANLAPSFHSWWRDGRPPDLDYKSPAEADVYGLTIRQMLAPQRDDPLSSIGAWRHVNSGAGFPAEKAPRCCSRTSSGATRFSICARSRARSWRRSGPTTCTPSGGASSNFRASSGDRDSPIARRAGVVDRFVGRQPTANSRCAISAATQSRSASRSRCMRHNPAQSPFAWGMDNSSCPPARLQSRRRSRSSSLRANRGASSFVAATHQTRSPGDQRELSFALIDPRLSTVDADVD
jgi:hypothetical protein